MISEHDAQRMVSLMEGVLVRKQNFAFDRVRKFYEEYRKKKPGENDKPEAEVDEGGQEGARGRTKAGAAEGSAEASTDGRKSTGSVKLIESLMSTKKPKARTSQDLYMKFGDIVYFKYSNQSFVNTNSAGDVLPIQWIGYMNGDGLSSDGLWCSHTRLSKQTSVSRFLFRVEPARRFFKNEEIGGVRRDKELSEKLRDAEEDENKYQEALKQNIGTPIYYGQTFFLRHIYSGDYITLNSTKLAKQVGSVRIGLAEASEYSSLKVVPSSRIKKVGDSVNYSDAVVIASAKEDHYFVHVAEYLNSHDRGLEINASETRSEWKPKLYATDLADTSLISKTTVVSAGSVLLIFNRHIGGYLSCTPTDFNYITKTRSMVTVGGQSQQLMHYKPLEFKYLDKLSSMRHEITVEIRSSPSFYCLWEVQRLLPFDIEPIAYFKDVQNLASAVRLKNVATQQYLCTDPNSDEKLVLSVSGHLDQCIFFFESKSGSTDSTLVSSEDLLKIKNYKGRSLFPQKKVATQNSDKSQAPLDHNKQAGLNARENEREYEYKLSDKVDSNSSTFELISRPREVTRIANQLSMVGSNLTSFYNYLQDWGVISMTNNESPPSSPSKTKKTQQPHLQFSYEQAFETEKELELQVKDVMSTLDMLYQYLSSEVSAQGNLSKYSEMRSVKSALLEEETISYGMRKKLLIEQGIMEILYRLAELIFFKTRWTLRPYKAELCSDLGILDNADNNLLSLSSLRRIPSDRFEALPQLIAQNRLNSAMILILQIMHLAVWDNGDCSNFLALKIQFFQEIIEFYEKEAMDVMREVAMNITYQEEEYLKFYQPWVDMLVEVSGKQGNVRKQIFLLKTLSALILDEDTNTPIEVFQTRIYESLFSKQSSNKFGFLKFALSSSSRAPDEEESKLQVIFLSTASSNIIVTLDRSGNFKEQNPGLAACMVGTSHGGGSQVIVKLMTLSRLEVDLADYVYYIAAYINLLTNLCRGRRDPTNSNGLTPLQQITSKDIGLDSSFCMEVMNNKNARINPVIKGAIAEFFSTAFIDRFPLKRLSKLEINCFRYGEISEMKLNDLPVKWINGELTRLDIPFKNEDDLNRVLSIMNNLLIEAFITLPDNLINTSLESGRPATKKEADKQTNLIHIKFILDYQIYVMGVLNEVIDFGFLDANMVTKVMTLAGLLLSSETKDCPVDQAPNLFMFIKKVEAYPELVPTFKQLLFLAVGTLKIVARMRENLQMLILIKLFVNYNSSFKDMKETMKEVFNVLSLSSKFTIEAGNNSIFDKYGKKNPLEYEEPKQKTIDQASNMESLNTIKKIKEELEFLTVSHFPLDQVLVNLLFNISTKDLEAYSSSAEIFEQKKADVEYVGGQIDIQKLDQQIRVNILEVITGFFNQRHSLLEKLISVELVHGKEEMDIYRVLSEIDTQNSIAAEVLTSAVNTVLNLDPRIIPGATKSDAMDEYNSKIAKINKILDRIIADIKNKFDTKLEFKKFQNLLKNKGYHEQFLRLLDLNYQKHLHQPLFEKLVTFFYYFSAYNIVNKKLLFPHISAFIDLVPHDIDSSDLVSSISQAVSDPKTLGKVVDFIFNKINQIISTKDLSIVFNIRSSVKNKLFILTDGIISQLKHLVCFKRMLSGMIFDEKNFKREETQRKIIFCLINNKDLVKIYEFKFYNEVKDMVSKLKKKDKNYEEFFTFYAGYISLLAELSWEFKMGIDQARRLVTKEQILEILIATNTPFFFKKHFLKCFHHIFLPKDREQLSWKKDHKLLEDILSLVISADLVQHLFYLDELKGDRNEEQMEDGRNTNLRDQLPSLTKHKDKPKKNIMTQNPEDLFIDPQSRKEYWQYLHSEQRIDARKYGLLYFTHYILSAFYSKEIENTNNELGNIKMEIRGHLVSILEQIKGIERSDEQLNYAEIKVMICECLAILPPEQQNTAGKNMSIQGNPHRKAKIEDVEVNRQGQESKGAERENLDDTARGFEALKETGSEDLKSKCRQRFTQHLRKYLLAKRLSYEELFNLLVLTNSTDFIRNTKEILGIDEKDQTLEVLIGFQVRTQREDFSLADAEELTKEKGTLIELARVLVSLEADELTVYQSKEKKNIFNTVIKQKVDDKLKPNKLIQKGIKSSDTLRPLYQEFVKEFVDSFLQNRAYDTELSFWITALRQRTVLPSNTDDSLPFLRALQTIFIKSDNKLFLLRSLRILLNSACPSNPSDRQLFESLPVASSRNKDKTDLSEEAYARMQNLFDSAEVPILCLSVINEHSDPILVDEACNVLCALLNNGNNHVQKSVFKTFEENIFTQGFFTYIKDRLESAIDLIRGELSYPLQKRPILEMDSRVIVQRFRGISNQDMIINILLMLKYFCDNCFLNFQNFLREQRTEKLKFNLHSVNMLDKLSDFLVRLTKENPDEMYMSIAKLVRVILNVLTEFVLGPCVPNQKIMIENRKIMTVVNNILEVKLNENTVRQKMMSMARILHQTAVFLESLVTGNEDKRLLSSLLESIHNNSLKKQLILIYILKVRDRKRLLFLDKYCHLVNQVEDEEELLRSNSSCTLDYCRDGKITYFDLMLVNTAFKIFLIIKQLEDKIPGNQSVESLGFKRIVKNSDLEYLQKKHTLLDFEEFNPNPKEMKNTNLNMRYKNLINSSKAEFKTRSTAYLDEDKSSNLQNPEVSDLASALEDGGKSKKSGNKITPSSSNLIHPSIIETSIGQQAKGNRKVEGDANLVKFFEQQKDIFYNEARTFFNSYVASLEILCKGTIEKVHFQIPYCCKYISDSIKNSMIREVNRSSDQERIESFFLRFRHYEYEMRRRQKLYEWRPLYYLIRSWKYIKYINFTIILIINIMMAFYFHHTYTISDNQSENYSVTNENSMLGGSTTAQADDFAADLIFRILTYIQVIAAFLVLVFSAYDRYPVALYAKSKDDYFIKESEQLKNIKFEDNMQTYIDEKKQLRDSKIDGKHNAKQVLKNIFFSAHNIYNFVLFIISVLSMVQYRLLYAVLLFDLINMSATLKQIWRSLQKSFKLLFLTVLLGIVTLYFYSVIGFNFFAKDYIHTEGMVYKNYCHTLLDCFISTMNNGIRARGGIGEALGSQYRDGKAGENYWGRVAFDLTFFFVIMMIILNLIFGIIIDSFGCMREESNRLEEDIENKCYICGLPKFEVDTKGEGWYRHIYESHNVYNYLYFLIYIDKKEMGDCSGVEKFAKELCHLKDISFFPISRSLHYEDHKGELKP